MELAMLVAAPCLFLMFFPEPLIALVLSIVAGVRLCQIFLRHCRARPIKRVDLWSIGGAAIVLSLVSCPCSERLHFAMIYFAAALVARFVVSIIVYREDDCISALRSMALLNEELETEIGRIKLMRLRAESLDRLRALDRSYNNRMQALFDRFDERNDQMRSRLREAELEREDAQQLIFDLREEIERAHRSSERSAAGDRIGDREVRRRFDEALSSAERELDIMSARISFKVMRALKSRLKELLERGVEIKIRYDADDAITRKAAKMLRKDFKRYRNFEVRASEARAKIFICDEKFYVQSGFNVLSFDGLMEGADDGEYSTDAESLKECREKYFTD